MFIRTNISPEKQKLIVYVFLTIVTLAVYWQVGRYGFINFDDTGYVTQNSRVQSGITLESIRWAFSTTDCQFWHPLTWLSLMLDYQLYGLNAGGYHVTNVILHVLSTLLLFLFLNRATGALWKSAFVAAVFALHPLHVESVAFVAQRKDVLSALFCMLTLNLYVSYVRKPDVKKYLLVLFSFICGLMSKSILVTLPLIMILLDYWPLKRFESHQDGHVLRQLKEKIPLLICSAVFSMITISAQPLTRVTAWPYPLESRIINALASYVIYLEKILWPYDLAVSYPFLGQLPGWQIAGAALLILLLSVAVIYKMKQLPYLFTGWLWYAICLMPVIGIIPVGSNTMSDHHTYLPSIGITVGLAWGIPSLIRNENIRRNILFPAAIAVVFILSVLTWHQCGYWKNSITLHSRAVEVTKDNYVTHVRLASALAEDGKIHEAVYHYGETIRLKPDYAPPYVNRGNLYAFTGEHQRAIDDYSEAIRLRFDGDAYFNRGNLYANLGLYQKAVDDYNKAIRIKPDGDAYSGRAIAYFMQGKNKPACDDAARACELRKCQVLETAREKGFCR